MGAIERFLERWGYARLDRYGLVKTPDGRILSNRPAVLSDGLNGKIVGWLEDDLAAMELDRWGEAPRKTVAGKKIISQQRAKSISSPPPLPGVGPMPLPGVAPAPIMAQPPVPAPIAIPAARPVPIVSAPAPVVAEPPPVEEDEWEWEIAMARARAAADHVEQAVVASSFTRPAPVAARPRRTAQGMAIPKAEPLPAWPKTEEIEHFRDEWTEVSDQQPRVMSPLEKTLAVARSTPSSGVKMPPRLPAPTPGPLPARSTVIPVPSLPTARPADLQPAFSTAEAPRRLGRGTGTGTNGRIVEDTVRTQAAPANDATSPYITMPSEVKPVGYAHTKRVAAKQR